jgi:CHASE3 domain sensor protein
LPRSKTLVSRHFLKELPSFTLDAIVHTMIRVKLVSEVLDGLGRWYVAVPPFLIVTFLAALFFVTGEGQARLQAAGERLQKSSDREHNIESLQTSLARAIAAERGFLLTEDTKYRDLYSSAVADVEPRLGALISSYAGSDNDLSKLRELQVLTGKRLADLSLVLSIKQA